MKEKYQEGNQYRRWSWKKQIIQQTEEKKEKSNYNLKEIQKQFYLLNQNAEGKVQQKNKKSVLKIKKYD